MSILGLAAASAGCGRFGSASPGSARAALHARVAAGLDEDGSERRDEEERGDSGEKLLREEAAPLARVPLGRGEVPQNLFAAAFRELEERGLSQSLASCRCLPHLLGADAAGREVRRDLVAPCLRELVLDVLEELDVVWVCLGHHALDYSSAVLVPRSSASRLRPRKIRDFTVPSATSVSSAISAYERPRTSYRTTATR